MARKYVLDGEEYPTPYSGVCMFCKHLTSAMQHTCAAFPAGIPPEIWEAQNNHKTPYPGDGGIRFERKEIAPDE